MRTDYRETWPIAYRTQRDAGVPEGEFNDIDDDDHRYDWADTFALGFALGLIVGLGLIDLVQTFIH